VAGHRIVCGLRDAATVDCWGDEANLEDLDPTYELDGEVDKLTVGATHFCALMVGGAIECRGENYEGSLDLPHSAPYRDVDSDFRRTCVVGSDGRAACVGNATGGTPPPADTEFLRIGTGGNYACGIASDRTLSCWGEVMGTRVEPPDGQFEELSVGGGACAIDEGGSVECWGTPASFAAPSGTFQSISVEDIHACGILTDSTVVCSSWFDDSPISFPSGKRYRSVSVGSFFACGIRNTGTVDCITMTNYPEDAPWEEVPL